MDERNDTGSAPETISLDRLTAARIAAELREAAGLAEQGLDQHVDRLREILADTLDRADAWALVKAVDGARAQTQPVFQLKAEADGESGEPVAEWLLIPFGEVKVDRPSSGDNFVFTKRHAESARRWFEQMNRKLAIDYEHQSFDRFNSRPDGLRPAAGWIGGLEVRDDGLWAVDVSWTERARDLLRNGEYKYFSPVIYWTDVDQSDVAALGPVALTNDPAMRGVRPLAASRAAEPAGDEHDEQRPETVDAIAESMADEIELRAELDQAREDAAVLRQRLSAQEADTFVERGMRLGKIVDSTSMDWRDDYLRDAEVAEARLSRAPVLLPPGRVIRVDERGKPVTATTACRRYDRNAEVFRGMGVEEKDVEAFERALSAGRIRVLTSAG